MHNGLKEFITGKLIIVSDSRDNLAFCCDIAQTLPELKIKPAVKVLEIPTETDLNCQPDASSEQNQQLTEQWYIDRANLLKTALTKSPWVCIEGPTGAGKSTFVNHELSQYGYKIFNGKDKLES